MEIQKKMNKLDLDYQNLLKDILENGTKKETRNGGTISIFGYTIRHKMSEGFPLLTTKKMAWKTMVTELLWFLRGDTNIKYLVDNNCHIWDGDAYKKYWFNWRPMKEDCGEDLTPYTQEEFINRIKTDDEFAKKWGELGPIYGKQWRSWERYGYRGVQNGALDCGLISMEDYKKEMYIDQIANLINDLKTNPDSRRLMVSAWNVGELDQMVLPPCHYGFQVYTRELSLEERLSIADKFNPLIREDCLTKTHHPDETEELKSQYRHEWLDSLGPNVVPQRRAISLMWNQRSVDTFLGLPFNIASYGLLLEIIAKMVNMIPDELIGNLGDVHLYSNHIEQAKEQIGRKYTPEERELMLKDAMGTNGYNLAIKDLAPFGGGMSEYYEIYKIPYHTRRPYLLPTLKHMKTDDFYKSLSDSTSLFGHLDPKDFTIENYLSHPTIKAPLSN